MVTTGNVPAGTAGAADCASAAPPAQTRNAASATGREVKTQAQRADAEREFFMGVPLNQEMPNIPQAGEPAGVNAREQDSAGERRAARQRQRNGRGRRERFVAGHVPGACQQGQTR